MKHYKICFSIAGSDPSGGAGIQADLKTFAALGCYGAAAITALTVQNTLGVRRSTPIVADIVGEQVEAVLSDLHPQTVKIGMTVSTDIISVLAATLRRYRPPFVVLDPVMVSSTGYPLLDRQAVSALTEQLMPLCTLITPNLPELKALTGTDDAIKGGQCLIQQTGCPYVLVKGGHREGQPTDFLISAAETRRYEGTRIDTPNTHGTGCTLSSAIAAYVARGEGIPSAVGAAKKFLEAALKNGADIAMGQGTGSLNHFFNPLPAIIG